MDFIETHTQKNASSTICFCLFCYFSNCFWSKVGSDTISEPCGTQLRRHRRVNMPQTLQLLFHFPKATKMSVDLSTRLRLIWNYSQMPKKPSYGLGLLQFNKVPATSLFYSIFNRTSVLLCSFLFTLHTCGSTALGKFPLRQFSQESFVFVLA